jgi:cytochrome c556
MLLRTSLAAVVVGLMATAVIAQSDPIAARKALMKGKNDNAKAMVQTMRGQKPFDAAAVNNNLLVVL